MKALWSVVCGFGAIVACASDPPDAPPSTGGALRTCVPNQTLVCLCGIDEGMQSCTEEGRLTPCVCGGKPPPPVNTIPRDAGPDAPHKPTATCGDHVIDPGEACDDGNTTRGDGCSAQCQPDGAPASAETCPGQPVELWKGSTVVLSGTTDGYADDMQLSCYSSRGPDRVYAVHPTADGIMTVDAAFAAGFNAVVEVRKDECLATTGKLLCEDTFSKPFKRVIEVTQNSTYYLIVDGDTATEKGAYTIRLELP